MYILYVDESGDPGGSEYSSKHYILSGLLVSQANWFNYLSKLKTFRKYIKEEYGLNQRTEIHASELVRINKLKEYSKIPKIIRINILIQYAEQIPLIFNEAKVINICLLKSEFEGKYILYEAWKRLIQRFEIFLKKEGDFGIIISDEGNVPKVSSLLRKMRIYNPTPSHYGHNYNPKVDNIIEDIFSRSSKQSYFIQTIDVIVFLLYNMEFPKGSLKKHRLNSLFLKLDPILLKEASKYDEYGIVRK